MKRARFLAAARYEFLAAVEFYEKAKPGQGRRFAAAVKDATARALAFPHAGSGGDNKSRRVLVQDFPFSVVYLVEPEGISIVAVAHHSRYPGYWRDRV